MGLLFFAEKDILSHFTQSCPNSQYSWHKLHLYISDTSFLRIHRSQSTAFILMRNKRYLTLTATVKNEFPLEQWRKKAIRFRKFRRVRRLSLESRAYFDTFTCAPRDYVLWICFNWVLVGCFRSIWEFFLWNYVADNRTTLHFVMAY